MLARWLEQEVREEFRTCMTHAERQQVVRALSIVLDICRAKKLDPGQLPAIAQLAEEVSRERDRIWNPRRRSVRDRYPNE